MKNVMITIVNKPDIFSNPGMYDIGTLLLMIKSVVINPIIGTIYTTISSSNKFLFKKKNEYKIKINDNNPGIETPYTNSV